MPRTRGECADVPRPCPFASCRHSLLVEIGRYPRPHEVTETCALDVADKGDHTLEDVGAIMNVTRERVRQIERKALAKVGRALARAGVER